MVDLKRQYHIQILVTCYGGELPDVVINHLAELLKHSYLRIQMVVVKEATEATKEGNQQKQRSLNGEFVDGNIAGSDCIPASDTGNTG